MIHPTAIVEEGATIGPGTAVWCHAHIRAGAQVGADCIVGEKTYLGTGVVVGGRVKINAFAYLCAGVTIEDGVMVSAATVFTNDRYPRAAAADLCTLLPSELADDAPTTLVREGATIGAACVIGCGLTVGRFAMVGMGSVVTRTVPDFHLALGRPARSVGCVCRCGRPLLRFSEVADGPDEVGCRRCDRAYLVDCRQVTELASP